MKYATESGVMYRDVHLNNTKSKLKVGFYINIYERGRFAIFFVTPEGIITKESYQSYTIISINSLTEDK